MSIREGVQTGVMFDSSRMVCGWIEYWNDVLGEVKVKLFSFSLVDL